MDEINEKIIAHLEKNARASWQEIGKDLFITGQAVAARVHRMTDSGVIEQFTIDVNYPSMHFITVYMQTNQFAPFEQFLKDSPAVKNAYKVSGEGCYQVVFKSSDTSELSQFLEKIERYGNYKVLSTLRRVK